MRREWLTTFLARKTAPKGSSAYLATEIARGPHSLNKAMDHGHDLALTLLGIDKAMGRSGLGQAIDAATDARAQVISLPLVLAAYEEATGPHTWRNVTDASRRYFSFLAENGYTLAEVEQIAAGAAPKPKRPHRTRPAATAVPADTTSAAEPDTDEPSGSPNAEASGQDAEPAVADAASDESDGQAA